ncbi:MAG: DUF1043 family protein [Woeseiaceae bacterium]|nr:DUF1043 family protein [Woeseiaceae bacterium]
MPDVFALILIALVCLTAGAGAGFWFGQRQGRADAAKSDDVRREFDAYREQVAAHFGKTADHFQALGVQVRELYDHMATGADALCDRDAAERAIEFSAAKALEGAGGETNRESGAEQSATPESEAEEQEAARAAPKDYESPGPEKDAEEAPESFTVAGSEDEDPDKRSLH